MNHGETVGALSRAVASCRQRRRAFDSCTARDASRMRPQDRVAANQSHQKKKPPESGGFFERKSLGQLLARSDYFFSSFEASAAWSAASAAWPAASAACEAASAAASAAAGAAAAAVASAEAAAASAAWAAVSAAAWAASAAAASPEAAASVAAAAASVEAAAASAAASSACFWFEQAARAATIARAISALLKVMIFILVV